LFVDALTTKPYPPFFSSRYHNHSNDIIGL
jgi:hypothetical protein